MGLLKVLHKVVHASSRFDDLSFRMFRVNSRNVEGPAHITHILDPDDPRPHTAITVQITSVRYGQQKN